MPAKSDIGSFTNEPLKHWSEILQRWCAIVEQHCQITEPHDVPWWNTEVPNASLVAAAAIQCGYAALVEPQCRKGSSRGRLDLWFQFRQQDQTGNEEECVEFKVANHPSDKNSSVYLDDAIQDASKIAGPYRARIGACVFKVVTPRGLDSVREELVSVCSPDALAWAFPACVRDLKEKDDLVPGVVLAMKLAANV